MTQLTHIVNEFRAGKLDAPQLFTRIEELLGERGENLDELLVSLQQEHASLPLPLGTFVGLRKHLIAAAAPQTEVLSTSSAAAVQPSASPPVQAAAPRVQSASAPPSAEEAAAKQAIGAVLAGRFKLVEFIGAGGTSRLYKATDLRKVEAGAEDSLVAVKVLTLPFKDTLEALAVLNRETEGLQALAHPNIVRVIDCDRDGDTVFMTMEFIRGKTLHALMRGSRFLGSGRNEIWPVVQGIANAVEFAHSKFIVHGDLTPGNVMVNPTGDAKVIDFGIARIFGAPGAATLRLSGHRSGSRGELAGFSPAYASPEMLELREPDPRDDIYSLACIVWELLTGAHPFGRRNAKDARDEGIELKYNDKLTRAQYAALSRALRFDRERRTPNVKQFMTELTASPAKRYAPYATAASFVLLAGALTYAYFAREPRASEPAQIVSAAPIAQAQPAAPIAAAQAPAPALPAVGEVFRDCPTCPLMTVLPAGEFLQGSPPDARDAQSFEMPQRRVRLAQNFAASRTEITVGEFAEFAQATNRALQPCATYDGDWKVRADVQWKNAVAQQTPSHPVSCISWGDANDYARWLSARTGKTYRLPSTSEWEYAARAGSQADRPWTTDAQACTSANVADRDAAQDFPGWAVHNCSDAYVQSAPVASFTANAFGLHDMLGNVFEWVADCWHDSYQGAPADGSARSGACAQRELRGGSWFTAPAFMRFAYRNRFADDYRSNSIGFRVVRELTP